MRSFEVWIPSRESAWSHETKLPAGRNDERQPGRDEIDNVRAAFADVRETSVSKVPAVGNQTSLYRILDDVVEYLQILTKGIDDPREIPFAPDVTR